MLRLGTRANIEVGIRIIKISVHNAAEAIPSSLVSSIEVRGLSFNEAKKLSDFIRSIDDLLHNQNKYETQLQEAINEVDALKLQANSYRSVMSQASQENEELSEKLNAAYRIIGKLTLEADEHGNIEV